MSSRVTRAPTRKQLRKEKRQQKKARKNEYFSKSKHPKSPLSEKLVQNEKPLKKVQDAPPQKPKKPTKIKDSLNEIDQERKKDMNELATLKKKMAEQRRKQLLLANEEEDRNIKKLEKLLKLKKKSKKLPKMIIDSGLDYIHELLDPEQMKAIAAAEGKFTSMDDEFAEDVALITGNIKTSSKTKKPAKNKKLSEDEVSNSEEDYADVSDGEEMFDLDEELSDEDLPKKRKRNLSTLEKSHKKPKLNKETVNSESDDDEFEEESDVEDESEMDYEEESETDVEDEDYFDEKNNKNTSTKEVKGKKTSLKIDDELEEEVEDENSDVEFDSDLEDLEEEMEDEESGLEEESDKKDFKKKNVAKKEAKRRETILKNHDSDIVDDLEEEMEDENGDIDNDLEDGDDSDVDIENDLEDVENSDVDIDNDLEDFDREIEDEIENDGNQPKIKGAAKVNSDGTWEDIYGRLHAKDGSLINKSDQKYIPPAIRAKMSDNNKEDKETLEKLNRLKKQLKGLLNRLALNNMHNIAKQIENLYMSNSRNDMNETLGTLVMESIISQVLTPERLLMEHIFLVAILHANIGTEVGAHFLQVLVSMFDKRMKDESEVEDKTLDNVVIALSQMYNFKVFDSKLMHEILNELGNEFTEKNVDCILHVLRNVGFVLRKDDPLALKNYIMDANKKAASVTSDSVNGSRLRFLLDVLTAIKNNNMTKIPNYDDSYSEHLKKNMKNFIRKGNYVTQLNITLEDLLKAEEKGKWWVLGSAWTGNPENREKLKKTEKKHNFSKELLEMARKMRMNTDTRRDIFCVIASADGYDDAFEKLMHLGLTKVQEREIIHVILHCCVKENPFNPYYAYLAQKFCEHDRKHMLTLKYSIWDKVKAIEKQSANCVSSLAGLLIHLFLNGGLPISTLKVIQFAQMDSTITRFLRQIFLGILLHKDTVSCLNVFKNVAQSDKLKMFRESLRLFLQIFVRKNLKSDKIDEAQREMLRTRSKMIERLLVIKDTLNL